MKIIEIDNGTDWVKLNCDTSKLTDQTSRNEGELYGRFKFNGTITVYKDSYDLLDTIVSTQGTLVNLRVWFNGESFLATMDSEQNNNIDFRYKDLKIKATDEYSNFVNLGNTEYNYLEASVNSEAIFIQDADPPSSVIETETITETVITNHSGVTLNYSGGVYLFDMGHGALTQPTYDIPTLGTTFSLISAYYRIVNFTVNSETVGVTMNADITVRTSFKKRHLGKLYECPSGIIGKTVPVPVPTHSAN